MAGRKLNRKKLLLIILLLLAGAAIAAYFYWPDKASDDAVGTNQSQSTASDQPATQLKTFPVINLQLTVAAWAAKQDGRASVVVYDFANKKRVASLNPDRQYFSASIYKLYVAYIGYQKIADGTYNGNEPYLSGYSRAECLDAMIRDSYSPCGEKWWNELGKQNLTEKMKAYGLKNTSLTGLYTSAGDAAIILQRLFERQDLTKAHRNAFLDSMKDQPELYRRGLPSGFSESAVYNKVGWNLQKEWHDTAIVTLPNGRSYVVTVLSENVGSSQIKALGEAIESRLNR